MWFMIPRALVAVAYATDRSSHATQFKGVDPDKKDILKLHVDG